MRISDFTMSLQELVSATNRNPLANQCSPDRYSPSQADVKVYQATKKEPPVEKYPHAYRWFKHMASFEHEFSALPGDPSKDYTAYGPESSDLTVNPAKAADDDDDDEDLFGSEEEDEETVRVREERLAEYKKKKEGKTKPAAKSMVTLDVKPWGMFTRAHIHPSTPLTLLQMTRPV